jgi:hypothetical protein
MISHGLLIDHIPMAQQAVSNLPPSVLEVIVHNLAFHSLSLVLNLTHHPCSQRADYSFGRFHKRVKPGFVIAEKISLRLKLMQKRQPILKIALRISCLVRTAHCPLTKTG